MATAFKAGRRKAFTHGGKRPGAGRNPKWPKLGRGRDTTVQLPEKLLEAVDQVAGVSKSSRSETIVRILLRSRQISKFLKVGGSE